MEELQPHDPRRLGSYQITARLGWGRMGQVYLGHSPRAGQVAVTLIDVALAEDPGFRDRFGPELAAARKVSGGFTAPVVDADLTGPRPWLATRYIAGPSLAQAVAARGPMPAGPLLELAADLARGLAAIHDAGIAHRDLRPSNVLLSDDGPKLINYWTSRAAGTAIETGSGQVPGFTSPEQAERREASAASNIFSLGAILTFAATGHGPFADGTADAMAYQVLYYEPRLDGVPPALRQPIVRCLAKNPADRPTCRKFLAGLADARARRSIPASATSKASLDRWIRSLAPDPPAAPAGRNWSLPGQIRWSWTPRRIVIATIIVGSLAVFVAVSVLAALVRLI